MSSFTRKLKSWGSRARLDPTRDTTPGHSTGGDETHDESVITRFAHEASSAATDPGFTLIGKSGEMDAVSVIAQLSRFANAQDPDEKDRFDLPVIDDDTYNSVKSAINKVTVETHDDATKAAKKELLALLDQAKTSRGQESARTVRASRILGKRFSVGSEVLKEELDKSEAVKSLTELHRLTGSRPGWRFKVYADELDKLEKADEDTRLREETLRFQIQTDVSTLIYHGQLTEADRKAICAKEILEPLGFSHLLFSEAESGAGVGSSTLGTARR